MTLRTVVVDLLLGAGGALIVLACAGVVLMRDTLDRLHYVTPGSLGGALVAAAVLVQGGFSLIGLRAILLAALMLVSAPVLAHATARAIHDGRRR